MLFRSLPGLAAAMLASTLAGCTAVSVVLAPAPLTLATGAPGADYHPVGNAICRMFNLGSEHQPRPCVATTSAGSVENIRRLRRGESAFALAQADVAHAAFDGEQPFTAGGADRKLRLLIALYPEAFTVVARGDADLREFQALRGRRLGVGKSGAGSPFTRDVVLAAYGWATADLGPMLELDPGTQEQALCSNRVDAVFFVAGHPNGVTQGVTAGCGARLVRVTGPSIDRLVANHSWYLPSSIPGGMYAGNPDDVPTIATQAVLLASSDLPDELAHAVVKAVFGNFADFRRLHPVLSSLDFTRMVPRASVIPIHPGALTYYREAGLVQ